MNFLPRLIAALILVESSGQPSPPRGDGGRAAGPLQIHAGVVADVNTHYGTAFRWPEDAEHPARARQICSLYIYRWASRVPNCTPEQAARIWNGGPRGHLKAATLPYARRVTSLLSQKKEDRMVQSADRQREVQVTDMDFPETIIPVSQFGRQISNRDWSDAEVARIRRKGADAFVKVNGGGRIAVFCKR